MERNRNRKQQKNYFNKDKRNPRNKIRLSLDQGSKKITGGAPDQPCCDPMSTFYRFRRAAWLLLRRSLHRLREAENPSAQRSICLSHSTLRRPRNRRISSKNSCRESRATLFDPFQNRHGLILRSMGSYVQSDFNGAAPCQARKTSFLFMHRRPNSCFNGAAERTHE
jgi:hypothetical protein